MSTGGTYLKFVDTSGGLWHRMTMKTNPTSSYEDMWNSKRCIPPTCFGHLLWPSSGRWSKKDI